MAFVPDFSKLNLEKAEDILGMNLLGAQGSAFAIDENRFLTCAHVIEPLRESPGSLTVLTKPRTGAPITVYRIEKAQGDGNLDIALLHGIAVKGQAQPLALGTEFPEHGEDVIALGAPLPLDRRVVKAEEHKIEVKIKFRLRVTRGIVASRDREEGTFEVDVHFNPGLSGGPVVSVDTGLVVGIVQAFRRFSIGDDSYGADLGIARSMSSLRSRLTEWGIR